MTSPVTQPLALEPAELRKIAEAYDAEPWWYDLRGFFILTFSYRSTLWRQVAFFADNIVGEHLEGAVGSGTLLSMVLRWRSWRKKPAAHITGFDYAEAMLAGAARRFEGRTDVSLHRADAAHLPFSDGSFDSLNVANAVHCFPDVDGALAEMHRVLRPGKRACMNVLLHPRGKGLLRRIAERLNAWGRNKGILHTSYELEDFVARVRGAGFSNVTVDVSGNSAQVIAEKAATRSGGAGTSA